MPRLYVSDLEACKCQVYICDECIFSHCYKYSYTEEAQPGEAYTALFYNKNFINYKF